MKKSKLFLISSLALLLSPLSSCNQNNTLPQLTMTNLTYDNGSVYWDKVDEAKGYSILLEGGSIQNSSFVSVDSYDSINECYVYDVPVVPETLYTLSVSAMGDNKSNLTSEAKSVSFRYVKPVLPLELTNLAFDTIEGILSWKLLSKVDFVPVFEIYVNDEMKNISSTNIEKSNFQARLPNLKKDTSYKIDLIAKGNDIDALDSPKYSISETYLGREEVRYDYGMKEESSLYNVDLPDVFEDSSYYLHLEVITYIYTYRKLPCNYITKAQKDEMVKNKESLEGKNIGGDIFYNREGALPLVENDSYREVDVNVTSTSNRGAMRVVFDVDSWDIYYTSNHYSTFTLMIRPIII